jgi:Uma2 family endonuclease
MTRFYHAKGNRQAIARRFLLWHIGQKEWRMTGQPIEKGQYYTWSDYQGWSDDGRWEIIGGEVFDMTPSPSSRHQHLCGEFFEALAAHFKKRECRVMLSPLDVRLSDEDIVQPDLVVVCRPAEIQSSHLEGAPTLGGEILSGGSIAHDRIRKFGLYARSGVQEYWVVTPYPLLVEVFTLKQGEYVLHGGYEDRDTLKSAAFPDLELPLKEVADFPVDPEDRVKVVRETTPPYAPLAAK